MPKRFTDTDKWKKSWIKSLPAKYKLLWIYLLDDCNHAGIWDVDMEVASLRLGIKIKIDEVIKAFGDKIQVLDSGNKWFIPNFLSFQYGKLNSENRAHKSVLALLEKVGIRGYSSPLQSPSRGAAEGCKDMDKDKDKDKDNKSILDSVVEDLNQVCHTSYKPTSLATKELISARLKEGFTLEDFKIVHRNKAQEWLNDPKMAKYLRPMTLYCKSKFECYLNQKEVKSEIELI